MNLTAPPAFTDNDYWMTDDGEPAIVVAPDAPEPLAAALDACRLDRRRF